MSEEEYNFVSDTGCSWKDAKEWLFIEILGGCSCADSEYFCDVAWEVLDHFAQDFDERTTPIYDKPKEYELMAHWMDRTGLTDHGSTVYSSWLTDKGRSVHETAKANIEALRGGE